MPFRKFKNTNTILLIIGKQILNTLQDKKNINNDYELKIQFK